MVPVFCQNHAGSSSAAQSMGIMYSSAGDRQISMDTWCCLHTDRAADADADAKKTVVLKDAGASKIAVIKIVREITGLGLVEAKGVADNGGNIKENVSADEANEIKAKLEEAGATVELV